MGEFGDEARAMLKIERLMETLTPEAQRRVAFNVHRTYGGPLTGAERSSLYRTRHALDTEGSTKRVTESNGAASRPTRDNPSSSLNTQNKNKLLREQATEVIGFLNEKAGKHFRYVDANLKLVMARIDSGATVADCKAVIARKAREWNKPPEQGKQDMRLYLRPATLFAATNFEQYLGEMEPALGMS